MSIWNKKEISKEQVEYLQKKYSLDPLTASILSRRNITSGKEILYFMEDDLRFQHSPFLFSSMEDAVDRIIAAKEENEKVLIFGDKDVDGITSTTVLYNCLQEMGIDVTYKLPQGDDAYGLSIEAVENFAKENGSLIITVDCGIANHKEINKAYEYGIDVIVVDHHNVPETTPENCIIINPKLKELGYPFCDISGCAVVFKLVSALRFSKTDWYKTDVALLNIKEKDNKFIFDCIKVRNLVPVSKIQEILIPGEKYIQDTKIFSYLKNQLIIAWNEKEIQKLISDCFGFGTEFNLLDLQKEMEKISPKFSKLPLSEIKMLSKIAKYGDHEPTEIGGFYNIYVSYVLQSQKIHFKEDTNQEQKDLQLVALAALADIMPMKNENRILVRNGLCNINNNEKHPGLNELISYLRLNKKLTSTDLSWSIVPNLNAAGRLGKSELGTKLFLEKDDEKRQEALSEILNLNKTRKELTEEAIRYSYSKAEESISKYNNNLFVVIDERINKGVSGIVAQNLVTKFNVPGMVITSVGNTAIGSIRSCRNFTVTTFLNKMKDIFINFGGHNFAAGFSLNVDKLEEFQNRLMIESQNIQLEENCTDIFEIDAEVPSSYLSPDITKIVDRFEPFGEENPPILFLTRNLTVKDAVILGKGDKKHLKILVDCGKNIWPCIFWNQGDLLNTEFSINDKIDIVYTIEKNYFNKVETNQLIIKDLKKLLYKKEE